MCFIIILTITQCTGNCGQFLMFSKKSQYLKCPNKLVIQNVPGRLINEQ